MVESMNKYKEYSHKWYLKNKKRIQKIKKLWHLKNKEKQNKKSREYNRQHKKILAKQRHNWYLKNRDYAIKYTKDWVKSNKEHKKEYDRLYHKKNAEKTKLTRKEWTLRNRDKVRHYCNNRFAKIRANGGNLTLAEWEEIKKLNNYRCKKCKRKELKIKLTIDHIKPISKGGKHTKKNIQPLCKSCNSKKNNKIE